MYFCFNSLDVSSNDLFPASLPNNHQEEKYGFYGFGGHMSEEDEKVVL